MRHEVSDVPGLSRALLDAEQVRLLTAADGEGEFLLGVLVFGLGVQPPDVRIIDELVRVAVTRE